MFLFQNRCGSFFYLAFFKYLNIVGRRAFSATCPATGYHFYHNKSGYDGLYNNQLRECFSPGCPALPASV